MLSGLDGDFELRRPTLAAASGLLAAAGLPTEDLPPSLEHFLGCGAPDQPLGIVGLELYGSDGLLRSLVVAAAARRSGIGRTLVAAAERRAAAHGAEHLYLLTETAGSFFAALGYRRIARSSAPEAIRNTREFSQLCPDSAALMSKALPPPGR